MGLTEEIPDDNRGFSLSLMQWDRRGGEVLRPCAYNSAAGNGSYRRAVLLVIPMVEVPRDETQS